MSARALTAVFAVALVVALAALVPLRLVVGRLAPTGGVTVLAAEGVVWRGRLALALSDGAVVGPLNVGLSPLALLTGTARWRLTAPGGLATPRGDLVLGRRRLGVERLDAVVPLARLGAPAGWSGQARLRQVSAVFARRRCASAGGEIVAALRLPGGGPPLRLSGRPACRDGLWRVTLRGGEGAAQVNLTLDLNGDLAWRSTAGVATLDPALGQALAASGFRPVADGWRKTAAGRLGG